MDLEQRHRIIVSGDGPCTMLFAHGFGCDQNMWRFVAPHFEDRYRTIRYDLVGSGKSDLAAYDRQRYATLEGHARDALEIIRARATGPVIFVGHSVSAMIGVLAEVLEPGSIAAHVMVGPSPRYIDDEGYVGGFSRADIESLLDSMEGNYLGWSSSMAPAIMGAPDRPELAEELTNSFCRTDPDIAAHFARVTFLSDNRDDLRKVEAPSLILQCSDDLIAPVAVGEYLARELPRATLRIIENVGHCPHLSAATASLAAIDEFLAGLECGRARP